MKNLFIKLLLSFVCCMTGVRAQEYYEVDYIYYNLHETEAFVAGASLGFKSVSIPSQIEINGIIYPVTGVEAGAFKNKSTLEYIFISKGIKSIGRDAFYGCSKLSKVVVQDIVAWCSVSFGNSYSNPLYYAHHLYKDKDTEILDLVIPDSVTSIRGYAFYGCDSLCVYVHDNITSIGGGAFSGCKKVFCNRGGVTLLSLWRSGCKPYQSGTEELLDPPAIRITNTTQTTVTLMIRNFYDEYTYKFGEVDNVGSEIKLTGLKAGNRFYDKLIVYLGSDFYESNGINYTTEGLYQRAHVTSTTASSLSMNFTYRTGDLVVKSQKIKYGEQEIEGKEATITGLCPNTSYSIEYIITDDNDYSYSYQIGPKTDELSLTTLQPKVISVGNVIVAAESNLDDEETNVGFEWRRIDWTDDFASNTGGAYIYEGTMEGYIRNLNAEKLWKFRPYYIANNGLTYYGAWIGLDPTNTSYFEPTVHTYAKVEVQGNTVLVKGYAMRGSDNVISQGFKYWKQSANAREETFRRVTVPSGAQTVEATGQVMNAMLDNLDYETQYCFVAFMKTSEGETFYGEQQTFVTGMNTTSVESVPFTQDSVFVVARYDVNGRRISEPQRGLNILRMSDGTVRKILLK